MPLFSSHHLISVYEPASEVMLVVVRWTDRSEGKSPFENTVVTRDFDIGVDHLWILISTVYIGTRHYSLPAQRRAAEICSSSIS
jgi:hypothetical protein